LLREALEALSPEYREVLVLRELEELSYVEIASVTKIPIGTVMSRLSRARKQLQASFLDVAAGRSSGLQFSAPVD
jgi:RNA polymerase sigma-70 factor (ECF subfamily)